MRIARIRQGKTVAHAVVEGERLRPIEGDIFADWKVGKSTVPFRDAQLLAPIAPPNIVCIGLNYVAHAQEGHVDPPKAPVVFLKPTTTICGPGAEIPLPSMAPNEVDYEAELAVIIGKTARNVAMGQALDYVLGYSCANDVSARDCQRGDAQWARGKSFDGFAPIGPWLETELNPLDLRIRLTLNGQVMQDSRTSLMIFNVPYLISYLSQCMTLLPGTVILTGTPSGCGSARIPPVWMKPGDQVAVDIEGIGALHNTVVAAKKSHAGKA